MSTISFAHFNSQKVSPKLEERLPASTPPSDPGDPVDTFMPAFFGEPKIYTGRPIIQTECLEYRTYSGTSLA